ncbi:hypothetical protein [Nocardia barduliensis]|nr:hypothetical protein [Nocardia barduliensis]
MAQLTGGIAAPAATLAGVLGDPLSVSRPMHAGTVDDAARAVPATASHPC